MRQPGSAASLIAFRERQLPEARTAMDSLAFLAEPPFVIGWYLLGAAGAVWAAFDLHRPFAHPRSAGDE